MSLSLCKVKYPILTIQSPKKNIHLGQVLKTEEEEGAGDAPHLTIERVLISKRGVSKMSVVHSAFNLLPIYFEY